MPPLGQAYDKMQAEQTFGKRMPSREQVARAWALAMFSKPDDEEVPSHEDLVTAVKKIFPEFREPKKVTLRPPGK